MQQFISSYGYLAVFVLMLAESACIPVPSELTMLLAGALSAGAVAGAHLNLVLAITAGVAGNVAGSYLAWGIGVYGGRAAWHRWGRYILLRDDDIDRAERWFGRHVVSALHGPSYALAALCGLLVIFAIVMLLRRRRRERGEPGGRATPGGHSEHGTEAERAGLHR